MNIPQITSIDTALRIYYSYSELGNKEITELFGNHSTATISRLKQAVKSEMVKCGVSSYGMYKISTPVAYEIWGINVADLEKRRQKLRDLNLTDGIKCGTVSVQG